MGLNPWILDSPTLFCGKVENGMDYIVYCEVLEYDSIMLNITDIALHTDITVTWNFTSYIGLRAQYDLV